MTNTVDSVDFMATPAKIVFTPFDEYLELESKSDVKHGLEIAVDASYG